MIEYSFRNDLDYRDKRYLNILADNIKNICCSDYSEGYKNILMSCCSAGKPVIKLSTVMGSVRFKSIDIGMDFVLENNINTEHITFCTLETLGKLDMLGMCISILVDNFKYLVFDSRELRLLYYSIAFQGAPIPKSLSEIRQHKAIYNLNTKEDSEGNILHKVLIYDSNEPVWRVKESVQSKEDFNEKYKPRKMMLVTDYDVCVDWENKSLDFYEPIDDCVAREYTSLFFNLKGFSGKKIKTKDLEILSILSDYKVDPQIVIDNRLTYNEASNIVACLELNLINAENLSGVFRGKNLKLDQGLGLLSVYKNNSFYSRRFVHRRNENNDSVEIKSRNFKCDKRDTDVIFCLDKFDYSKSEISKEVSKYNLDLTKGR